MLNSVAFAALLIGCCYYAWRRGGPPEQLGAAILAVGSVLTLAVVSAPVSRFHSIEIGILLVDLAALAGFLVLALCAERFWPLWVTSLHAIGTTGHAVKLADPEVMGWAYHFALAFWSYPMLLLIVLGTWNHQKRLARNGVDKSWSSSSDRWDRRPPAGPSS
jgi:hypothetical protein